ncbi:uncharacterized protein BDCG_06317 [Blastomyces dermatitidis ER-3]|uniref:Uncharacterized protein n=1 Tax=Ajellomyces dermatitidis (strain ER-3 / ATCC MYA-2586) TaxID=559297 RepID=A0ABP2F2Z1_AJEDR|nr:uncharacterized protein BDCG_06317 [Blastomyces dermatitidis ER-3]EEQ91197.2 hypothetical protein BDCG_06317 [Blastomyces dermatitidis ER-3]
MAGKSVCPFHWAQRACDGARPNDHIKLATSLTLNSRSETRDAASAQNNIENIFDRFLECKASSASRMQNFSLNLVHNPEVLNTLPLHNSGSRSNSQLLLAIIFVFWPELILPSAQGSAEGF